MCNILILDDDKAITDLMITWLKDYQIIDDEKEVMVTKTVDEAKCEILNCIDKDIFPSVLFVDIRLGHGHSGLDFIEWFRQHDYISCVYVITGHVISSVQLKMLADLGIDGLFKKPLDFDSITILMYSRLNRLKEKERIFNNLKLKEVQHKHIENLNKLLGEMKILNKKFQDGTHKN